MEDIQELQRYVYMCMEKLEETKACLKKAKKFGMLDFIGANLLGGAKKYDYVEQAKEKAALVNQMLDSMRELCQKLNLSEELSYNAVIGVTDMVEDMVYDRPIADLGSIQTIKQSLSNLEKVEEQLQRLAQNIKKQ